MEEPVTIIDRDTLKVLSVDTRMDIIKELSQGERTPSDLGKRLKKSDATIVEHLNGMIKVGLVKKIEHPGKKWIFYTLTEKGRGVISSKSRRLIIILSGSIIGLILSGASFVRYQAGFVVNKLAAYPSSSGNLMQTGTQSSASSPLFLYISIGLLAVSLVGLGFYFVKKPRRNKYEEY
jgi:DNA-binding HxlR family transcriptional regulator